MRYIFYSIYSFFRYDAPRFLMNIWKFKKALYHHYSFDYQGIFYFLEIGIKDYVDSNEKYGFEILTSRMKKIEKMRRASQILHNHNADRYLEMAEKELGKIPEDLILKIYQKRIRRKNRTQEEADHIKAVYKRTQRIEKEEWDELMLILKGQDYSTFDQTKDFHDQYDGTGLKTWWD